MTKVSAKRTTIFISYSHKDSKWLERLQVHLKPLERGGRIDLWDDTRLQAGAVRDIDIQKALASAKIAVLLISADYLASDCIFENQLTRLLEATHDNKVRILPVLISTCSYDGSQLEPYQLVNPGKPISSLKDFEQDELFTQIARIIRKALLPTDPVPQFPNDATRHLSEALEAALQRKARLASIGRDTANVQEEILDLKRKIREGGQLKPGDFLADRFILIEEIGSGGFATIWQSIDNHSGEVVAVKVLHGQYSKDHTRRERFFRGAKYMASLRHQGIVDVIEEQLEDSGFHFFVMEYLADRDLRQFLLSKNLSWQESLEIILKVGAALEYAHGQGIIHRDVKPTNILLGEHRQQNSPTSI